jgi:hypothetical protein
MPFDGDALQKYIFASNAVPAAIAVGHFCKLHFVLFFTK